MLTATPASAADQGEALLEGLSDPEAALERLAELTGASPADFGPRASWACRVELDGTALVLCGEAEHWEIRCARGTDASEGMSAARRLHGLLGALSEGWDDDR